MRRRSEKCEYLYKVMQFARPVKFLDLLRNAWSFLIHGRSKLISSVFLVLVNVASTLFKMTFSKEMTCRRVVKDSRDANFCESQSWRFLSFVTTPPRSNSPYPPGQSDPPYPFYPAMPLPGPVPNHFFHEL